MKKQDIKRVSRNIKAKKALSLTLLIIKIALTIFFVATGYALVSNLTKEVQARVAPTPKQITDRYIDCANLGECIDITTNDSGLLEANVYDPAENETQSLEVLNKGDKMLGLLTTHKGVYINEAILKAIDEKFSPADATKLKTIMLAECARDYKVDGKAVYECRSTVTNQNKDGTWDCGYLQINQKTQCTQKSFEIDYQIEKAYNKLNNLDHESCGKWNCWSSYKFRDSKVIKTNWYLWASK